LREEGRSYRQPAHRKSDKILVTALSPAIGYDKASAIAHKGQDEGTTLREVAIASGVSNEEFDRVVPKDMVGDPEKDLGAK
jgi:fumarate hydratase, class II